MLEAADKDAKMNIETNGTGEGVQAAAKAEPKQESSQENNLQPPSSAGSGEMDMDEDKGEADKAE